MNRTFVAQLLLPLIACLTPALPLCECGVVGIGLAPATIGLGLRSQAGLGLFDHRANLLQSTQWSWPAGD